jgi:para-nitrobenzyl esterase
MQQVTPPVSNPNNYLPVYTKSVFNSSNGTSFDWTLYTAAEVAAWGVSPGKGVIRARVSENLPPSGATNSNISGATVTASSWLHPDVPYIVKYDNGSGLPGTGISTLTNGVFYVMNVDEGDIVTVDSLANGYTFQSLGYKVHADAVSQGRIIGAAAPTGIVATTAATANGDGSYSGTIQVCFSLTPSATYYGQIYYTTDGSDPRFYGASLAIGATFSLSSTATVRYVFRSTISNTVGPIGSTTFNWPPAPVTSISLPGNTYNHGPISVTLTPNGPASTYYCLGSGCTPTTPYTGPIAINTSQALNYYSMDSAGNTEITKTAVYTINVTLSVNLAGSGAGNVNSITAQFPFACNTGACSPMTFTYGANSTITLAETPSTSVFSGWDGACVDKSSNCTITMDGDKNVTAFFDTTPVLKLLGPPDSYHHIPSEALSAMTDNTSVTLQGQATTISNDFTLNRPITIKFSGGYDAGFQPKSGSSKTVIAGKVTISSGKLIVDKLAIVGSNVNGTFQSGVFMNSSVVQGLDYATPSISGVTDTNGTYMYNPGETAVFSVGCLELGSTLGKSPVTLFDLVPTALSINDQRLINISKFLQSLSTVTDVTTRIVLTDAVKNAICSAGGINFNQSSVDFASDINVINVLNATGKSLLSDPQVIANLNSQAIRTTSFGKVAGMYSPDSPAFVWSDIPYAAPPINALRWKPPVDPASWATTKTVTTTPNVCMQKGNVYSKVLGIIRKIPQSEDCLTLNIWSPVTGESNLPVIVYVHGGSNMTGYGFSNMQWGGALVAEQKVVFVSINYRLNLFGWLNHPALHTGDSINDSGNFGTLDIIQALKFVKNNIASFGGDPNNITLAGQSAGAGNTWSLITSPMSAGLFHKAVPMSHGWTLATVQGGQNYANMILQQMLIRDGYATDVTSASAYLLNMSNTDISNYLYSQTADQIVGILSTATVASTNGGNVSSKFLDGTVLPPDSATAFSGNYLNSVPVLSGTTNEEGKWYGSYFAISNTAWSNMLNSDPDSPTLTVADVIQPQYLPADKPFTSCTDSGYNAINLNAAFVNGDTSTYCINYTNNTTRFWQLQINALNRYQPLQQKTYAYNFAWAQQAEPMKTLIGAAHVADVPFMLNTMTQNTQLSSGFSTVNKPGRDDLSLKMRQSLSAFMRTGDPNNPNLGVTWLPWSTVPGEAKRLIFDADYNFSNISMSTSDTQIPR